MARIVKGEADIWDFLKSLSVGIFSMALVGVFMFVLFAGAMLPQIGLIWFVKEGGGGPMLLPIIALSFLGKMYGALRAYRFSIGVVCAVVLAMAEMRGFYWHPFEHGDGFLTINRASGFAIFLFALASTELYARFVKRFGWPVF